MALPTASDNPFPSILAVETAAASIGTPAAGKQRLFVDTDHVLKYKNSAGVVSDVGAGGSGVSSLAKFGGTALTGAVTLSEGSGITLTEVGQDIAIAAAGAAAIGSSALVYRYTVTGSDKASIDTGVDTPDAGSNDWTNGDLLEIFLFARTDEAGVTRSTVDLTFNNDGTSVYDRQYIDVGNTSVSGASVNTQAKWQFVAAGNAAGSGVCGSWHAVFPNYRGTTFNKDGSFVGGVSDTTSSSQFDIQALNYRSTTAVSRLKVIPDTGGVKFKVGTQLLIYKRLAS